MADDCNVSGETCHHKIIKSRVSIGPSHLRILLGSAMAQTHIATQLLRLQHFAQLACAHRRRCPRMSAHVGCRVELYYFLRSAPCLSMLCCVDIDHSLFIERLRHCAGVAED